MIKLMSRVLKVILMNSIVPVLVKTGHLDHAIHDMRLGAVDATMARTRASKRVVGKHFDRSERWVYLRLEEILSEKEAPSEPKLSSLIFDVMDLFSGNLPEGLSLDDVFDVVKLKYRSLERYDLVDQFQVYVDVGLLIKMKGVERYRAAVGTTEIEEAGLEDRLARIGRTAKHIIPAGEAYARGDSAANFGSTELNVTVEAGEAYVKDVKRYMAERGHQAVMQSLDSDPDNLAWRSFTILFASAILDEEGGG